LYGPQVTDQLRARLLRTDRGSRTHSSDSAWSSLHGPNPLGLALSAGCFSFRMSLHRSRTRSIDNVQSSLHSPSPQGFALSAGCFSFRMSLHRSRTHSSDRTQSSLHDPSPQGFVLSAGCFSFRMSQPGEPHPIETAGRGPATSGAASQVTDPPRTKCGLCSWPVIRPGNLPSGSAGITDPRRCWLATPRRCASLSAASGCSRG